MRLNKQIGAVLFDFDGVILKSLEEHYDSWNAIFADYNVRLDWDEFAVTEGQSLFAIARQFCANHSLDTTLAPQIAERKNKRYLSNARFATYEGVGAVLDYLRSENTPMAVVTGAHKDRFDVSMAADMREYFTAIVTADDVRRTKPDPEPFLTAAQSLEMEPVRCLVVENAPLGVRAAKAAGMMCYGLTTTLSAEHLKEADWTGPNLVAFLSFIQNGIT